MSKGTAVLQFEIDRTRWLNPNAADLVSKGGETPMERLRYLASTAMRDTIRNGGTFVLVATEDKITMVQRADAETFEETK